MHAARPASSTSVVVGSDPVLMLTGPIPATRALLERTGLGIDDIDVFEINEAFASVVLAWQTRGRAPIIERSTRTAARSRSGTHSARPGS